MASLCTLPVSKPLLAHQCVYEGEMMKSQCTLEKPDSRCMEKQFPSEAQPTVSTHVFYSGHFHPDSLPTVLSSEQPGEVGSAETDSLVQRHLVSFMYLRICTWVSQALSSHPGSLVKYIPGCVNWPLVVSPLGYIKKKEKNCVD